MPPMTETTTPRSPGASGQPEPLTEKAQREASLPIDIYGDSLVRHPTFTVGWFYQSIYKPGLNYLFANLTDLIHKFEKV